MKPLFQILCFTLLSTNCIAQNSLSIQSPQTVNQDDVLKNIVSVLKEFSSTHFTEKVYLQLDRALYAPGDTIWYKAYTVIGEHHQLSVLSGVLHVELINPNDSVIARQAIQLTSGAGWSNIPIPFKISEGNFHIRAYTNWMRNDGPAYFYNQSISVGLPARPTADLNQNKQSRPDVQFFPEGGQLVNGVRSRLAFKVVGADGLGKDVTGTVEDNEGNVVADLATQHLGMGIFALLPQAGKTYKAKIVEAGEASFAMDLPQAADGGLTLGVNNSLADSIFIKVATNEKTFNAQKNNVFYITAQSGDKIYYTAQGQLDGQVYMAKVEKSRFPSGIVQFTLFTQSGEPVAERVVFVRGADMLKVNLASAQTTSAPRKEVHIDITAQDDAGKPVMGNFSVAVINESLGTIDEAAEGSILNNLLLTSDLKGYIEKPNYYFTNLTDEVNANLDILMLTQGYRRFEWKKIIDKIPQPVTWQPERSLELAGSLKTKDGIAAANGRVTLAAFKQALFKDTSADDNGNFKFTGLQLADTTIVSLHALKASDSSVVNVNIRQPDYPKVITQSKLDYAHSFSTASFDSLQMNYSALQKEKMLFQNTKQLKEVKISANKIPKQELEYSDNLNGPGNANQVIMGDKLQGCINLSECLQGKIMGVMVKASGVAESMRAQGRRNPRPMAIIINGILLGGAHLNDVDPNDVESIEVLLSGVYLAVYGSNAANGALVITLKKGTDLKASDIKSDLINYPFIGFYKARDFYSPKYEHQKNTENMGDYRTTIYWNPNINTNKEGKASFEFFNADAKGTYRAVIEGIDDNGDLGRQVLHYKVE